ncbi:MAG: tol-pal system protein YbgF [candidate division Zixibacteria bacterium]|nr:tol-pal system protein YbgF [candidate division Zixibacteria bacterium]
MMKKNLIIAIISTALLAIFISGCATRRQMAETSIELNELQREHRLIMATLQKIDSLIVEQSKGSKKLNADLKMSMSALEERMLLVESNLEDAVGMINRSVEMMDSKSPGPNVKNQSDSTKTSGEIDHQKVYKIAYQDVIKGNYKMAVKGFENYLQLYPKTTLADNAVYWIGECYYIQKDYTKSQSWYNKLIEDYPKSEHMASAKLKLGMSLYKKRYRTKAKQYFQDVVNDFPGTDEANQAAEMLQGYKR